MYILVFGILILFIIIVNIKHKKAEVDQHTLHPWKNLSTGEIEELDFEFKRMKDPLYRKAIEAMNDEYIDAELAEYKKTDSADMHRMRRHMYGKSYE